MYALKGEISGELISYGGRILVHDNRRELEFLFPRMQIVDLGVLGELAQADGGRPTMLLKDHPDMGNVLWPLERNRWITTQDLTRR